MDLPNLRWMNKITSVLLAHFITQSKHNTFCTLIALYFVFIHQS